MKALNQSEVEIICQSLQPLVSAQLQEAILIGHTLGLGLWTEQGKQWLVYDHQAKCPTLLGLDEFPVRGKKITKPVVLFIKAHLLNKKITQISLNKDQGRVITIEFGSQSSIEIRLFPHGQNLLVAHEGKTLSWEKVKTIATKSTSTRPLENDETRHRSIAEILEQWRPAPVKTKKDHALTKETAEQKKNQDLKKLKKAIVKIEKDLTEKKAQQWEATGQWLKTNQSIEVPKNLLKWVDPNQSFSWNLNHCFAKSKQLHAKIAGSQERLRILQKQLQDLLSVANPLAHYSKLQKVKKPVDLFVASGAKGRRTTLKSGRSVFAGKTAKDNIDLLRKAKPWEIWLHIKDMPGRHGILVRNKNEKITDQELQEAAHWLIQSQLGPKFKDHLGERFEVLSAERRYVRPIKGDRLGRVNYQNEKVLVVVLGDT